MRAKLKRCIRMGRLLTFNSSYFTEETGLSAAVPLSDTFKGYLVSRRIRRFFRGVKRQLYLAQTGKSLRAADVLLLD